ncbi:MAG: hypothetical protein ACI4PK_03305 [Oscillospiraceae bacterium]
MKLGNFEGKPDIFSGNGGEAGCKWNIITCKTVLCCKLDPGHKLSRVLKAENGTISAGFEKDGYK